jgi:outer membrane protein OmpA-like peptidoglycan-associated protein
MLKNFKVISAVLFAMAMLSLSSFAKAQEVTLRVEPGVAIPLTDPQAQRFGIGGALAVKPEIGLGSYFSLGPSASVIAFPSTGSVTSAPTMWTMGGFARVKRPHDEKNTGSGFTAVSPWVDADLQYVYTGGLDRFGWAVAAGASVPTSDARNLWVGPFVRYEDVHQDDGKVGVNTNDSKTLILGLSFELGAKVKKMEPVAKQEPKPVEKPAEPPILPFQQQTLPPPKKALVDVELKQTVQFAWDSPVLDKTATAQLDEVVKKITSSNDFKSIRVEGHASSEGQVKHNDALSKKRAQAVVDFLAAHGVPKEKLSAVGFGSTVPVATNKTAAGRVLNRRAEFVVNFVIVKEVK